MRDGTPQRHAWLKPLIAVAVFWFACMTRFTDPGGSFAGLTDDHFFYLVRGWQILFGDLPVRDFVDHGAPLFYYIGAAIQVVFGRGTLSEIVFCVTVLAIGAALTFRAAAVAAGSVLAGLAGVAFHVLLEPRFYNYPKIIVYAIAIPLLWRFADVPSAATRVALAVLTAVAFLLRHDHGVFVAVAMAALLVLLREMPARERVRHLMAYAATTVLILAPYLIFVEMNGGVLAYLQQASEWASRDRGRAPVVFPGLISADGFDRVALIFYIELLLPFLAFAFLAVRPDAFRPHWPNARAKIGMVALLALVLDAGFLRSPLGARLADPSVPLAILLAWLAVAAVRTFRGDAPAEPARGIGFPLGAGVMAVFVLLAMTLVPAAAARFDPDAFTLRRVTSVARQLQADWDLRTWISRDDRPELIDLSLYLSACTAEKDRVLVQAYIPQVAALARRAFAGGHADLRPGFFKSDAAQRLTIERLRSQSVPVVLLEAGEPLRNFRNDFPLVTAYLDDRYAVTATRSFERFGITLLVERNRQPAGTYEPLGWPCFASGDALG